MESVTFNSLTGNMSLTRKLRIINLNIINNLAKRLKFVIFHKSNVYEKYTAFIFSSDTLSNIPRQLFMCITQI